MCGRRWRWVLSKASFCIGGEVSVTQGPELSSRCRAVLGPNEAVEGKMCAFLSSHTLREVKIDAYKSRAKQCVAE